MLLAERISAGDSATTLDAAFQTGLRALGDADWRGACAAYRGAVGQRPDCAEAWEGLAEGAWWVPDLETIFEARERAYELYRERGDGLSAARMATWLAMDSLELRGQDAIANGWLQIAYRLLQGHHDTEEYGWLLMLHGRTHLISGDAVAARRRVARAVALAAQHKMADLEALSVSLEGLARLGTGDIRGGVRCLDKAAAIVMSGEVHNLTAEALTLCQLMAGCERIKDYDRARQWCARVKQVSEARTFPALLAVCRPHYASILMWQGRWQEAEEQLEAAGRELVEFMPPFVAEATVRLADLRGRQGRWDEAETLFEQVEGHGATYLGLAEVTAAKGDLQSAVDLLERHLRQVPAADSLERAPAMELLVRCLAGLGDFAGAEERLGELREIARGVGTHSLRASAAFAEGVLATFAGDWESAQRFLEDSVDLFERGGAPFESARARIALAEALVSRQRLDVAAREAEIARETLSGIGALKELERADKVLATVRAMRTNGTSRDGLTAREGEILTLLSHGRSNQEIAADLVLSVRTVERHISNIYQKLGLEGRTARTAAAAYAHRLNP